MRPACRQTGLPIRRGGPGQALDKGSSACPAELREGLLVLAKKLWSALSACRRPLRLGVFARHIFFLLAKTQRPARRGGRKEIVPNSLCLPYFSSYSFFLFSSRKGAKKSEALNNFLLWGNFNLLLQRSNMLNVPIVVQG